MSEINTVLNKSSKQLITFAKTLNNSILEDRIVESLLISNNADQPFKKKVKHKFSKHPDRLTLDSDLSSHSFKNGYSQSSLVYNCNKSCDISVTHSEHSVLSGNIFRNSKTPQRICLTRNQSFSLESQINLESEEMDFLVDKSTPNVSVNKKVILNPKPNHFKLKLHENSTPKRSATKSYAKADVAKTDINRSSMKSARDKAAINLKLRGYIQRILECIEEIRMTMITGIEPPDGAEDWERARTRTVEFSARFSRNYLYPLGREMNELQGIAKNTENITHSTAKNIHRHLLSAHHVILIALQAYRSNMATLLANALAERLHDIIEQCILLCNIHTRYLDIEPVDDIMHEALIENFAKRCNSIIQKIHEVLERRDQIGMVYSANTKLSLMGYKVDLKKSGKQKKNSLETRLSMYSITSETRNKDRFWKRTVESLAKDKLKYNHVQSRYKTAGYKHRPVVEKPATVVAIPGKIKLFGKRSSGLLRNTPIATPKNEDRIVTMVEMQKEKELNNVVNAKKPISSDKTEHDCEHQASVIRDIQIQALTPIIQSLCRQICPNDEAVTQKQLEILLKGLLGMALNGKINNVCGNINSDDKESGSNNHTNNHCMQSHNEVTPEEIIHKVLQNIQKISYKLDINENLSAPKKNGECSHHLTEEVETNGKNEGAHVDKNIIKKSSLDDVGGVHEDKIKQNKDITNCSVAETTIKEYKVEHKNDVQKQTKSDEVSKQGKTDSNDKNKPKRRHTITAITGAKNAQLICIRDDDSINETIESALPETTNKFNSIKTKKTNESAPLATSTKKQTVTVSDVIQLSSLRKKINPSWQTQRNFIRKNLNKHKLTFTKNKSDVKSSKKDNVKINRISKKTLKQLVLIPNSEAYNVVEYKFLYGKFLKENRIYKKSSRAKVQPWDLIDLIAEHLLNDLLLAIVGEIQIDQVLENLYHSEFQ